MLNRKLVTIDGKEVYPAYTSFDDKLAMRREYGDRREYMWCGCRADCRLYYRVSVDAKLYPEHKDYIHARGCIFEQADRKERAFVQDGENGESRIYLSFDPKDFSVPADVTADSDGTGTKRGKRIDDGLNYYPLEKFVRQINTDTYNERVALGKPVLSADYFLSSLHGRLKNIFIDGCRKPVREYRLESDRWQFFYMPFYRYEIKDRPGGKNSCSIVIRDSETGKEFSWFIYEHTLNVAVNRFTARYGCPPTDVAEGTRIIMSGFRYIRKKKDSIDTYKVVGRLCFFVINDRGLICESLCERDSFDSVFKVLKTHKEFKFLIGDVGENIWGYFEKTGTTDRYVLGFPEYEDTGNALINDFESNAVTVKNIEDFLEEGKRNG